MKKLFISLLIVLVITANIFVQATENITPELASPIITTPKATPPDDELETPSVTATPTAKPSDKPPFTFTVTTADGKNEIIQGENSDLQLVFNITPNKTEDFTILKIENYSTGSYPLDSERFVNKNSSTVSYTENVYFDPVTSDQTVSFILHWEDFAGNSRKTSASFKIKVAVPKLTVTATPDGPVVPGAPVVIKYHIANVGNVPVKNILLQDPTAAFHSSNVIFSPEDSLVPGAVFERQATIVIDGEITLSPTVTYFYNGNSYSADGAEEKLSATEVIPTLSLSCDKFTADYKGALHEFSYTITNTTEVKLINVYVYDGDGEDAGVIEGPFEIEPGAVYTGEYKTVVDKSGYYKFKITYSYEGADGEKEQTAKTEQPLEIPNEILFTVEKATPEKLDDSGKMTFTLLVKNPTSNELRNVTIEEFTGLIDTIKLPNAIPASYGANVTLFRYEVPVSIPTEATQVQFFLNYTINDEAFTLNTSYDIEYVGSLGEVTPTPDTQLTPAVTHTPSIGNENDNRFDYKLLLIFLLIFLFIFLLVFIIVLFILKNKKDAKTANISVRRKMTDAFDDFDDDILDADDFDSPDVIVAPIVENAEQEPEDGEINNVTSAILDAHSIEENQEFSTEFNDEVDDEGVKIFKSKK